MSVLRMIKLFGWERRVQSDVAGKREEELGWIWKRKMLGVANNILKCVPLSHLILGDRLI